MKISQLVKKFFTIFIFIAFIISLTNCKKKDKEEETSPVSEIQYKKKLIHLSDAEISNIVSVDSNGTIIFNSNSGNIKFIQPDFIIVGGVSPVTPYGFLKKVVSTTEENGNVRVTTSNANMEDVLVNGGVNYSKTLTLSDLKQGYKLGKGIKLKKSPKNTNGLYLEITDVIIYDKDGDPETEGDQIKANGSLDLEPTFHLSFQVKNGQLEQFRFSLGSIETDELEISAGAELLSVEKEYALASFPFAPITIFVGWVPIVVYPVLEIDVGAKVSINVSITTAVTQSSTKEYGIEYLNGTWNPIANVEKSFTWQPPIPSASLDVQGYIGPQFNLLLYGVAGPYADASAYLKLEADIFSSPWWSLYGGAEIGVGVQVIFLGKKITDYYIPAVIGYKTLIAQASGEAQGTISGQVKDAVSGNSLSNVKITARKGITYVAEAYSNYSGEFSLTTPVGTDYIIEFSKSGYLPVIYNSISVEVNKNKYLETVLQINEGYSGEGTISGTVVDALTGVGVSGLDLKIRNGMNTMSGAVVSTCLTNSGGNYQFSNLSAGNYTIEGSGAGYVNSYFSVLCIGGQVNSGQNGTITPILNDEEYRIILTWGENPQDLDSHLTGPDPGGDRFHIYFANRTFFSNGELFSNLDLDDVTSFGPETTTIYIKTNGMYRYSVHDYTDRGSSYSVAMSNSNAQVRVYKGSVLLQTYNIPGNTEGTLWTVFELAGNTISPINSMSYESSSGNIQKSLQETDAALMRNLPSKK